MRATGETCSLLKTTLTVNERQCLLRSMVHVFLDLASSNHEIFAQLRDTIENVIKQNRNQTEKVSIKGMKIRISLTFSYIHRPFPQTNNAIPFPRHDRAIFRGWN